MARKRIFFVSYGGGHATIVARVAQALFSSGNSEVDILALTSAHNIFVRAGIPFHRITRYVDWQDPVVLRWGKELAAAMHTPGRGISWEESVAYLGMNMAELVAAVGKSKAKEMVKRVGRHAFYPVDFFDRVLACNKPDVVVTTNCPRSERAALDAAQRRGIPTVRIEDLFAVPSVYKYIRDTLCDDAKIILPPLYPTRTAVMTERARQNACRYEGEKRVFAPLDTIHITGQPVFARAYRMRNRQGAEYVRTRLNIPTRARLITWATDGLVGEGDLFQKVREIAGRRPNWHVVIKLHPGTTEELRRQFAVPVGPQVRIVDQFPLHDLLVASDVVLTQFSTVGIEALIGGRTLVLLDLWCRRHDATPYIKAVRETVLVHIRTLAAAVVEDLDNLDTVLEAGLSGKREGLTDQLEEILAPSSHESAAARIANLIAAL